MTEIPTVKIKCGDDYAIINESDFDPEKHELFDAPKKEAEAESKPRTNKGRVNKG